MTYSIVARDPQGVVGVATASKFLAIGATVPAAEAGVGAVASQGHTNPVLRELSLAALRGRVEATGALDGVTSADPGRSRRQVAAVGRAGRGAAWTGPGCTGPAGHRTGDGWAVVGNLLHREEVLDAMAEAFRDSTGPLGGRLLEALAAGEEAGGDSRGRQSAALLVRGPGDPTTVRSAAQVDLRVDDHPSPVAELRRLLHRHDLLVGGPGPDDALPIDDHRRAELDELLRAVELAEGAVEARLATWAHRENLEHRLMARAVDAAVLAELRRSAGTGARTPGA